MSRCDGTVITGSLLEGSNGIQERGKWDPGEKE